MKRILALGAAAALATSAAVVSGGAAAEAAPVSYTVSGYTWNDVNSNYRLDKGEPRLSKKVVYLYNSRNKLVEKVSTDRNGRYLFTKLARGTYTVKTGKDKFAYSTLVGSTKKLNSSKALRSVKLSVTRNTGASFGFYTPKPKPVVKPKPAPPKPAAPNYTPGNLSGWSAAEVKILRETNHFRVNYYNLPALVATPVSSVGVKTTAREVATEAVRTNGKVGWSDIFAAKADGRVALHLGWGDAGDDTFWALMNDDYRAKISSKAYTKMSVGFAVGNGKQSNTVAFMK